MKTQIQTEEHIELLNLKIKYFLKKGYNNQLIKEALANEKFEPYFIDIVIQNIEKDRIKRKNLLISLSLGGGIILCSIISTIYLFVISGNLNSHWHWHFWEVPVIGIIIISRGLILYK